MPHTVDGLGMSARRVAEEILKEEEEDRPEEVYSKEDEEKINERLKGLGYL